MVTPEPGDGIAHGTTNWGYRCCKARYGRACDPCRAAQAAQQRAFIRRRYLRGGRVRLASQEETAAMLEHLMRLRKAGMDRRTTARLAGVREQALQHVEHGRVRRTGLAVVRAVLALPVPKPLPRGEGLLAYRALRAAGWGPRQIAAEIGLRYLRPSQADDWGPTTVAKLVRLATAEADYLPPAERAELREVRFGGEHDEQRERALRLVAQGVPAERVAEQLHVTRRTVERWKTEARREGSTCPSRPSASRAAG